MSAVDSTKDKACASVEDRATRPKRVLIYGINYTPEPIGVGKYSGELGEYLVKEGVEVDVVTAVPHYPGWALRDGYRNRYKTHCINGARVTHCPLLLKKNMRGLMRALTPLTFAILSAPIAVWRILIKRYDTVLCVEPTLFSAPLALLAAKMVGARTVLHVQDLEIDAAFGVRHLKGQGLKRFANGVEGFLLRRFNTVITISNRMREKLEQKGVCSDRLELVRNWVDVSKIHPLDGPSSFRAELGIPAKTCVALYAGNIGAKQALPVLLDAAEHLEGRADILFVLAGDGPEKAALVAHYGHLKNVKFLPVQPEVKFNALLNMADAHILPQDRGAADLVLPSKLGGMLASGKTCMVMADAGTELHEFLLGRVVLLPSGDANALVEALLAYEQKPESSNVKPISYDLSALSAAHNLQLLKKLLTTSVR